MFVKSPLNYTGGKYKILPTILDLFPKEIDTFVDLFAGGFNVGINVDANKVICNDQITYLIDLYKYFQNNPIENINHNINSIIDNYQLSKTNTEGYLKLRTNYNETNDILELFVLTCYSFNHQIRFNNSHKFNTPFGKDRSSFNDKIEQNLIQFCNQLKIKLIEFMNKDFLDIDLLCLGDKDLVYCDPPYLITTGSYNDGKRGFKDWGVKEEQQLLDLLDKLNSYDIKFALSNVLQHKGVENEILIKWSKKYNVNYIDKTYSNCNYQFKNKDSKTVEVLITNY